MMYQIICFSLMVDLKVLLIIIFGQLKQSLPFQLKKPKLEVD